MREILFRGKRKDNGEWVEGFYSQFHNRPAIDEPNSHQIFELIDEGVKIFGTSIGGFWRIVDPETIGQYTGLTDKNDTKIFEGDIVKKVFNGNELTGKVGYLDGSFGVRLADGSGHLICLFTQCEVIGNIHDNPELLKGGVEE